MQPSVRLAMGALILAASAVISIVLKSGWPLMVVLAVMLVVRPRWWTVLILGFTFTVFLNSGWPLLGSLFFIATCKPKRWWPIPAGIAFGLVEVLSFYLSDRPVGITRGYTALGSMAEALIYPDHANKVSYWGIYEPVIDWTMALILGTTIGSFLSARYSGDFKLNTVPYLWSFSKGSSTARRWIWAFTAGVMMGFAARIAGGCVSGLLISGVIQLAPAGFIFMMSLWVGGVATTFLFYRSRVIAVRKD
ncbi:YeeE/YedE thiosulfate transporter family protein [Candidatus Magnetominusculus xianensis]|nr:YeeE/YedE thiosulfate transporter family protein [Candidatus Magnetominusculus xianensis]MBF0402640.1 YeeE/YedE family protein [Nitrospirota bacterium]